jgi:hypothetical protein
MERIALILDGDTPKNAIVIAEGKAGDDYLAEHPEAVEVTGLDPMPGIGTGWTYNGEWVAPVPPPLTREEVEAIRLMEYQRTADPLYFKWQAGSGTQEEWVAARQAVKDAHPYPDTP